MAVRQMLVVGRYRLLEPVGAGGMGRVWLARDEMLHRDVAVKEIVPPEWMSDAEQHRLRERTLREARSAARLSHPHVVRIYDVVHAEGLSWIVMEYVPSRSLYQVLNEDGPYDPAAAARIGLAVLAALDAAHRAGVLHRDVKPHNVLISVDGRVVLTDFGLATFVDDGGVTAPGLIVGSPQYVSPERARDGASTVESDLWSLGATLFAAVEGHSPYARETAMATLAALATEPPDPPVRAGPLAAVLDGLLRYEPATRLTVPEIERRLRMIVFSDPQEIPLLPGQKAPRSGELRRPRRSGSSGPSSSASMASSVAGVSKPSAADETAPADSRHTGMVGPVLPRPSGPHRGTAAVNSRFSSSARPAPHPRTPPRTPSVPTPSPHVAPPLTHSPPAAPGSGPALPAAVTGPAPTCETDLPAPRRSLPYRPVQRPETSRLGTTAAPNAAGMERPNWPDTGGTGEPARPASKEPSGIAEPAGPTGRGAEGDSTASVTRASTADRSLVADRAAAADRTSVVVPSSGTNPVPAGGGGNAASSKPDAGRSAGTGQTTDIDRDLETGCADVDDLGDGDQVASDPSSPGPGESSEADGSTDSVESHTARLADPPGQAIVPVRAIAASAGAGPSRTKPGRLTSKRVTQARLAVTALVVLLLGGSLLAGYVAELTSARPQVFLPSPLSTEASQDRSPISDSEPSPNSPLSDPSGPSGTSTGAPAIPGVPGTAGVPGAAGVPASAGTPGSAETPGSAGALGSVSTPGAASTPGAVGGPGSVGALGESAGLPGPGTASADPPDQSPAPPGIASASESAVAPVRAFSPSLCDSPSADGLPVTPLDDSARGVGGLSLQSGWSYFTDGTGFHIAVPDGWTYQRIGTTHCFRGPRNARAMTLDAARDPAADPLAASRAEESRLAASGDLQDYALIGVNPVPLLNRAADWEYRYRSANGTARHAVFRWFVMGGRAYALGWSTTEKNWASDLSKIQMIRSTFYSNRAAPLPKSRS